MIWSSSLRKPISQELQRGVHFLFQGLPQGEDIALWHIHFGPNEISNMKKSIQEEIEALMAETAAANAATAAYNREKEFYRQQADEAAVELEKIRAELLRADSEKAKLLLKYNALKNRSKYYLS